MIAWISRLLSLGGYLSLMLTAYYMAGWYHMYGLLLLSAAMLLILVLMYVLTWYFIAGLQVSVGLSNEMVRKGEYAEAHVTVINRGFLPIPKLQAVVDCSALGKILLRGAVAGRGKAVLSVPLPVDYCGGVSVRLRQMWVSDYLNFFLRKKRFDSWRKPPKGGSILKRRNLKRRSLNESTLNGKTFNEQCTETTLTVLPSRLLARFQPESLEIFHQNIAGLELADWDHGTTAGTDPYEIRQLRSYQPGDSLRDVHWKLSARTEELLSKQYGGQEAYCARLLLDLRTARRQMEPWRPDAFRELSAALSAGLLAAGISHLVCWYDDGRNGWTEMPVSDEEGHLAMSAVLVHMRPVWVKSLPDGGLFQTEPAAFGRAGERNALYFDTELQLYGRDGLLTQFSPDTYVRELEQRWIYI